MPPIRRYGRLLAIAAIALLAARVSFADDPRDALLRARRLYNERQFEGAIAAADEARSTLLSTDDADLIAARAYLERFRESSASQDLTNARERLRRIDPARLGPMERVELVIGVGEALYFDRSEGAAASIFDSLLSNRDQLAAEARQRVLDWWASAVDSQARPRADIERQAMYQGIRDRMRDELGVNVASTVASYWLAAAARGQGDLQGAWEAAEAGWVRAPLAADHGTALRADLDRLMHDAIVPERARALGQPVETLRVQWEEFKGKWRR